MNAFVKVIGICVAALVVAVGSPASAQSLPSDAEMRSYRQQVDTVVGHCRWPEYDELWISLMRAGREAQKLADQLIKAGRSDPPQPDYMATASIFVEVNALAGRLHNSCDSGHQNLQMHFAIERCKKLKADPDADAAEVATIEKRLAGFRTSSAKLYPLRQRELRLARGAAEASRIPLETAQRNAEAAEAFYNRARTAPQSCAPKRDLRGGDASGALPDLSRGENVSLDPSDPCAFEEGEPNACADWRPLLGRWTNPRFGGVIEFRLTADGTASATVVSVSGRMEAQGYGPGMEVIRGLRLQKTGGTWSFYASGGESFSAVHPDARPTDLLGQPSWTPNAAVFIEKAKPGVLNLPPQLEGRLSDYDEWEKMGSVTDAI